MDTFRKYFDNEQLVRLSEMKPNWGVNILNVGHNIHPANKIYPDVNHPNPYYFDWENGRILNEFQLVYISSGSGIFEAEHVGKVIIESGTVFLLFPGIWHRYKPFQEKGWEEYWVGFNGHYADYLMQQDCFNPNTPLIHIGFNTEFYNVFLRLIDTLKQENIAYSQIATCLTIQLLGLVYASSLLKEKSPNRKEHIINNVRYKIHDSWSKLLSMEELANQHNVSYVWFRKAFKEIIGVSPGQYLLKIKIEKACQMLVDSELSVSDIAHQCGFDSFYHFSTLFKKKIKMCPSKYREQNTHL